MINGELIKQKIGWGFSILSMVIAYIDYTLNDLLTDFNLVLPVFTGLLGVGSGFIGLLILIFNLRIKVLEYRKKKNED